jgi:hypothetical protein
MIFDDVCNWDYETEIEIELAIIALTELSGRRGVSHTSPTVAQCRDLQVVRALILSCAM